MRILPIFIIWAFVFFMLPKLMGNKKRSKQDEVPAPQNQPAENEGLSRTNKEFWRTWGREEDQVKENSMKQESTAQEEIPVAHTKSAGAAQAIIQREALEWKAGTNAWRGKLSRSTIRRGLIMKEVLGQPRALKPYGKDV
jgi:hypothetical protein